MPLRILGIDPGSRGALALYQPDKSAASGLRWHIVDIPDHETLRVWLRKVEPTVAYLERTFHTGSSYASYALGYHAGWIRGVLDVCDVPVMLVEPRVWKRHFGLKAGDKVASLEMARKLSGAVEVLKRKMDHNRAEAALIAAYGAEHYGELI